MFPAHATLVTPAALPRMAPELALGTYEQRQARQSSLPPSYSVDEVVEAILPDSSQRGAYELKRIFQAPRTLRFTPIKFIGDSFVRSNIITRVLQSEVDHTSKGEGSQTAINQANYKFSYKGVEELEGAPVHVFQVKPRTKRPELFKGRIFVDATTGALRRAEGTLVKSPSFFIKKVEFIQDYALVDGYTLPVRMHSQARTRLVGRVIVDIISRDYEVEAPSRQDANVELVPASVILPSAGSQ